MRNFLSIVFSLLVGLLLVSPVEAHVLQTDGAIGAVMHIDPEDDPIAGQPAYFFFEIKDTSGKFQPNLCDCTATVYEGNNQLTSQSIYNNGGGNLSTASFSYTFPQKDVYVVKLVGKPTQANVFQPFTLTYDIRVDREASGSTTTNSFDWSNVIKILGILLIVGVFVITIIVQVRRRKT